MSLGFAWVTSGERGGVVVLALGGQDRWPPRLNPCPGRLCTYSEDPDVGNYDGLLAAPWVINLWRGSATKDS